MDDARMPRKSGARLARARLPRRHVGLVRRARCLTLHPTFRLPRVESLPRLDPASAALALYDLHRRHGRPARARAARTRVAALPFRTRRTSSPTRSISRAARCPSLVRRRDRRYVRADRTRARVRLAGARAFDGRARVRRPRRVELRRRRSCSRELWRRVWSLMLRLNEKLGHDAARRARCDGAGRARRSALLRSVAALQRLPRGVVPAALASCGPPHTARVIGAKATPPIGVSQDSGHALLWRTLWRGRRAPGPGRHPVRRRLGRRHAADRHRVREGRGRRPATTSRRSPDFPPRSARPRAACSASRASSSTSRRPRSTRPATRPTCSSR